MDLAKLENYKTNNLELTKSKEELEAKVNYLERREQELTNQLEQKQMELSEKSELIDKIEKEMKKISQLFNEKKYKDVHNSSIKLSYLQKINENLK